MSMSNLWDEITGASWATKRAAKDGLATFKQRFFYWWRQRCHRETADMVESWWQHPKKCPY